MAAITLPVYNLEGKEVDSLKLNASVFDGIVNKDAIHQAVLAFRANNRRGLAATKTRGEVSGGGSPSYFPLVFLMKETLPALIIIFFALLSMLYGICKTIFKVNKKRKEKIPNKQII